MGMALTSCTVPSAGKPTFDLPEDQIEIGIGIHGEPGRHREPIADAKSVAKQLVDPILHDLDFTGAPVIAMLNGMGGTPQIELYLMYGEVVALLKEAGVEVSRNLVGNYITSLDMAGCSLTLVRADDEMIRLGISRKRAREIGHLPQSGPGGMIEVQGTAEGAPFSRAELDTLLALAERGIAQLVAAQRAALGK